MWTAYAEQQLFFSSVRWLNQVWWKVHLGQGFISSKLQRNLSKGKHTPCYALVTAAECLIVSWGRSSHLLFRILDRFFFQELTPAFLSHPATSAGEHNTAGHSNFTVSFSLQLPFFQADSSLLPWLLLQCHSTPTVIPAACSSSVVNLVQIFKAGITRVTPASSQGGQTTDLYNSITMPF